MTLTLPTVETPVEVETRTSPKISEALRLGAMSTTQGYHQFRELRPGPDGTLEHRYCALGTIMHAVGLDDTETAVAWKFLGQPANVDPILQNCCPRAQHHTSVWEAIIHLNDGHYMPRGQIADRLAAVGL